MILKLYSKRDKSVKLESRLSVVRENYKLRKQLARLKSSE